MAIKIFQDYWIAVPLVNDKVYPRTILEGPEMELRYSSTLSLTSVLDGGGWLMPCLNHFNPRKENRYPFYWRLGAPQGQSGWVCKISPLLGFDPWTVQTVASCYTNWAKFHLYYPSIFMNWSNEAETLHTVTGLEPTSCSVYSIITFRMHFLMFNILVLNTWHDLQDNLTFIQTRRVDSVYGHLLPLKLYCQMVHA